jgi:hypothetical protein
MWRRPSSVAAVALMVALSNGVVRADEGHKQPEDPDAGFLEFLGSVDRLSDVNPDYLSDSARAARPGDKSAQTPPPPPKPAPPRQALPPSASAPGVPKNE